MKLKNSCLLSIVICICFDVFSLKAQNNIVPNGSFEFGNSFPSCQYSNTSNSADDFDSQILNWKVARHNINSGFDVPEWVDITDASCVDNYVKYFCGSSPPHFYETNRFIVLSVLATGDHGAIRVPLTQNLVPGETYVIRMKVFPLEFSSVVYDLESHLRVHFTEKDVNWDSNFNNEKFEAINANIVIWPHYACEWNFIERTFTVPSNLTKLKNLVLYIESNSMAIDDVEIFTQCPDNLIIQNKIYSAQIYHSQPINSNPGVLFAEHIKKTIETNSNVELKYGSHIVYTAGEKIILKSGFKVEEGARFRAVIADCPNNIYNRIAFSDTANTEDISLFNLNLNEGIDSVFTSSLVTLTTNLNKINTENYTDQIQEPFTKKIVLKTKNSSFITIYPNPNNGEFVLEISNAPNGNYTLQITDAIGRSVMQQNYTVQEQNLKQNINLQAQGKGIYFVKINSEQINEVRKVVVE